MSEERAKMITGNKTPMLEQGTAEQRHNQLELPKTLAGIEEWFCAQIGQIVDPKHLTSEDYAIIDGAIAAAIRAYKTADIKTDTDYIISKYNECSLSAFSPKTDRQKFIPVLDALNSIFKSNLYDASLSSLFFDKLIALNFRTHNYEAARDFIKKAIAQEAPIEMRSLNQKKQHLQDRFRRRRLAVLCGEYIGLDKLHSVHGQKEKGLSLLKDAIELLIGTNLFSIGSSGNSHDYVQIATSLSNDECACGLSSLISSATLKKDKFGWNGPCLGQLVSEWEQATDFSDEGLNDNEQKALIKLKDFYKDCYEKIAHTLAHCLSEYVKYDIEINGHCNKHGFFLRISDRLIKGLGEKYVTCHATLLIERREYYSALNLLDKAKWPIIARIDESLSTDYDYEFFEKSSEETGVDSTTYGPDCVPFNQEPAAEEDNHAISDKELLDIKGRKTLCSLSPEKLPKVLFSDYDKTDLEQKKRLNEIALIEFYHWYYSVFSKEVDARNSKEMFHEFCTHSKDAVAATYYSVVNLKGLLIDGFNRILGKIRQGLGIELSIEELEEIKTAYGELIVSRPGPTIHTDIWKEWELLDIAYKSFCVFVESNDDKVLLSHRLYNLLILLSKSREVFETQDSTNTLGNSQTTVSESNNDYFYHITTEFGSFIYRGAKESLKKSLQQFNTKIAFVGYNAEGLIGFLHSRNTCDISNVYVALQKETIENDLTFILQITNADEKVDIVAKHSIYIDLSALSKEDIHKANELMKPTGYKDLSSFEEESERVIILSDSCLAVQLCMTYSCLERVLSRLYAPLDSNLISPISEDETYSDQSENQTSPVAPDFLKENDSIIQRISASNLMTQADEIAESCISSDRDTVNLGSWIDMEYLKQELHEIDRITHVIIIRALQTGTSYVNVFDIKSNLSYSCNALYADTMEMKRELLESTLNKLNKRSRYEGKTQRKNHPEEKCAVDCTSHYSDVDFTNIHFQQFRDSIYLSTGVLLPASAYVLLNSNQVPPSTDIEYTLFFFNNLRNAAGEVFDIRTCGLLKDNSKYFHRFEKNRRGKTDKSSAENSSLIVQQDLSMDQMIRRIRRVGPGQKYVFVSFRSNGNDESLCRPAFSDMYSLQCKLDKMTNGSVGVYLDAVHIGDRIKRQLGDAIWDPNCVGAIVYASAEYFFPKGKDGTIKLDKNDYCYLELKQLNDKQNDQRFPGFFVFPIVFDTPISKEKQFQNVTEYVRLMWNDLIANEELNRAKELKRLFDYDSENKMIGGAYYIMRYDGSHYDTNSNNLENALRDAGVELIDPFIK